MITLQQLAVDSGNTEFLFNISSPKQSGSRGVEVKFIQYLLYCSSQRLSDGQYPITEVDGVWGAKTESYMESAVKRANKNNKFLDDHIVSPMQPGCNGFANGQKTYKIAALQYGYATFVTGTEPADLDTGTQNTAIMGMPDDGTCPSELAAALRTARAPYDAAIGAS